MQTGHFWIVIAPERDVAFEYTAEHTSDAVDDVLAGYSGYLVADAHTVYDHLFDDGNLVSVIAGPRVRSVKTAPS